MGELLLLHANDRPNENWVRDVSGGGGGGGGGRDGMEGIG